MKVTFGIDKEHIKKNITEMNDYQENKNEYTTNR